MSHTYMFIKIIYILATTKSNIIDYPGRHWRSFWLCYHRRWFDSRCVAMFLSINNNRRCVYFKLPTKPLYEWCSPSVCPSVMSVTPFWLCSHHRIMKFSGVITNDRSDVHAKVKVIGQRSRSQSGRFWTVTPVWIHRWLQNDAQSLK